MEVIDFNQTDSVLNQFMAELRNVEIQHDQMRFRRNLERIGEIMAYEISRRFDYVEQEIQTPLGISKISVPNESIVLATVFRAGLPFHYGFHNIFDHCENAFVSAYRKYLDEVNFDIHIEYMSSPDIEGKTLILVDPMLATGNSMLLAYRALLSKGTPKKIHLAAVIAARQGVDFVTKTFPQDKTTVWCAAIDPSLNKQAYIIPGLGDAGDLAFGDK
ncbi:MAG TPA: uracil phosphoribosyltransferase [Bacteroidaceae bacterium]|nr:uracil phosphoribosyltransferase [Bacteroidaceae bacterium]